MNEGTRAFIGYKTLNTRKAIRWKLIRDLVERQSGAPVATDRIERLERELKEAV